MENDKERYFDFSGDDELLAQFSPDEHLDPKLKMTTGFIWTYLQYRNPLSRIAGLIAHDSLMSISSNTSLHKALNLVTWLLAAIVVLLAYIAYVLT